MGEAQRSIGKHKGSIRKGWGSTNVIHKNGNFDGTKLL
jgi:hypothetical protein